MTLSTEPTEAPSLGERAVKDTARLFSAQLVVGFVAVFCSAWLYHKVPEKELALWPLTLALSGLVAGLSSWGTGDAFVRWVPALLARKRRRAAGAFLKTGLLMGLCSCAIVSTAIYLAAEPAARWGVMKEDVVPLVRLMALATFFAAARERLGWALMATQRFRQAALETLIVDVPRPPLMVGLYVLWGIKGVIVALTTFPLVGCVLHLVWLRSFLFHDLTFVSPRALLRRSKAFYGVSLIALLRGRLNYALIPLLSSREALASYFVVDSVVGYLRLLDSRATAVVGPKLAERDAQRRGVRDQLYGRCMRYLFLGLLPLHVLVAALAAPAVLLYGGQKYAAAAPLLSLLCLAAVLEVIAGTQAIHIRAFSPPRHFLALGAADAVVNLGLFALLVPRWGAGGAAIVVTLKTALLILLGNRMLRSVLRTSYEPAALVTALSASLLPVLIAAGFQVLWPGNEWIVFPAGLLGVLGYFLSLRHRLGPQDAELVLRSFPRGLLGRPSVQALAQWTVGYVRRPQMQMPSGSTTAVETEPPER